MQKSSARKTRYAENFNYNSFRSGVLGLVGGLRMAMMDPSRV
jgi:hypothetical protein